MMILEHITMISCFAVGFTMLLFVMIFKKFLQPSTIDAETCDIENGYCSFLQHKNVGIEKSNKKITCPIFKQKKPFFSWSDHPCLVAHAVEYGWPTFSFAPSPSLESSIDISWEVFEESADFMQKIRVKESTCVIRAGLPLPGPQFANASFPKEAYFEIEILHNHQDHFLGDIDKEGEEEDKGKIGSETTKSKLIENHETSTDIDDGKRKNKIEELKFGEKQECEDEKNLVAIGLSCGVRSNAPLKIPGSFVGSVGFNSSGAVYLDGKKLILETGNDVVEWGREGNVIGCGFDPSHRKVFFTVNSQLLCEIRCKTEEFSHPLYPTLAANGDVSVVVNLGQSPFRFEAANSQRTSNPCFVTTRASCNAAAPNYELDSKELFSMGRIDGKWKQWSGGESVSGEFNDHALQEGDLFEIVAR